MLGPICPTAIAYSIGRHTIKTGLLQHVLGISPLSRLHVLTKRYVSSEIQAKDQQAGESNTATDTGVIHKTERETLIYFHNIYAGEMSIWNPMLWFNSLFVDQSRDAIRSRIKNLASPETKPIDGLELRSTIPVKRDGGVFATFLVPYRYTLAEVNSMIQQNTTRESSKSIFSYFTKVSAFPVKGSPWIEDLKRLPNKTIKIKFQGPILTEEEIYLLFRRYGKIVDIYPPKKGESVAVLKYDSYRGSICAKNCVSGIEINNTVLHIQYEAVVKTPFITNFFVNHTRIAIPVFIALLSIAAVLIFDPIREFFIEQKITHKYSLSKDNIWIKKIIKFTDSTVNQFTKYWSSDERNHPIVHLWGERMERVEDLKMWLEENTNTFVIIRGPRGSGKRELVMEHTLNERNNILYFDCDKIIKSRTDSKFLWNVANEIGYFPIFPWVNSFTSIIDLMVQGLTGQKTGLSESKETQFRNILTTSIMSIKRIALKYYKPIITEGNEKINIKEEDYLQQHPEAKPVIVIDRFAGSSDINGFIYKELADWAAMLVQMNVAHVIFLTENVASDQILSESFPNQVFKTLILSDASKSNAKNYVLSQLQDKTRNGNNYITKETSNGELNSQIIAEIDEALDPLGGRMLDLQAFVRRVKSGEDPLKALEKMVEQASEQITQIFLSDKIDGVKSAQAWELIEMLSTKPVISYSDIVFKPLFKAAPELGIMELEKKGLITVSRDRGVFQEIRPARPLFRAAFNYLVNDAQLSTVLKTRYLLRVVAFETKRIQKWEEELFPLNNLMDQKPFKARLDYLSGKIKLSSAVIDKCESEIKELSMKK
ncbi:Yme2p PWA37_002623 [Arxiozyma heterogenica]|uniref:Yme2p n=1 Tax=Arxiozyma heterogenica TaxID=278026 RepID=UPI002F0A5D2F